MQVLKIIALIIVIVYFVLVVLLYVFQTRLIFYPGKLTKDFKFKLGDTGEEIFIQTKDGERINALFYPGIRNEVILYFHGNAGDLSGWQFVAEDFTKHDYSILIIDYRGYGKSSGKISEKGFYRDAEAAYYYLINKKGFTPKNIIIYGRSIGTGVAVELATKYHTKGLVLEAPYASLKTLANQKLPFFFPSLFLKTHFDNVKKINNVKCPIIFVHGFQDTLIPPAHSERLFDKFTGKKKRIVILFGAHNDLHAFPEYHEFLEKVMPQFF